MANQLKEYDVLSPSGDTMTVQLLPDDVERYNAKPAGSGKAKGVAAKAETKVVDSDDAEAK